MDDRTILWYLAPPAAVALFFLARWLWIRWLDARLDRSVVDAGVRIAALGSFPGVAAAEIGALGAYSVYEAVKTLVMIDDRVLAAADFSGGVRAGLRGIHEQLAVQAKGGLLDFYADQTAAAHLAAEGHVVEFAQGAVPGADLLVDGHPFRVEIGLDPGAVREHLARFPDVGVIVNQELGPHFDGTANVLVDPALSHADATDHLARTVDRVGELQTLDLHFPLITFSLAVVAYTPLVFRRRLSLREAATHTAVDTGLIGVPAMTLGKIGALAGLGLGPVGSAVGGILGALAGGVAGAAGAGWFKGRAYRGSVREFHRELRTIGSELPDALAEKRRAAERKQANVNARFPHSSAWRARIWPTLNDRILLRLSGDFRALFARIEEQRQKAYDLLAGHGLTDASPAACAEAAGGYALELVRGGELWTPRLVQRMRSLARAADEANAEAEKLQAARASKEKVVAAVLSPVKRALGTVRRWLA